jgi:hypothetical protein
MRQRLNLRLKALEMRLPDQTKPHKAPPARMAASARLRSAEPRILSRSAATRLRSRTPTNASGLRNQKA